ncbi:MAG: hypothetical protein ABSE49_09480 [Polyangiaceae bacterium]|jgi:hypothetical protein
MPSTREDYEALPFPAGTSPFRIKGVAYRGHVDYAASFIRGGERAVIDSFQDPALRAFFDQPFLAASWYDAFPMVPAWHACAKLLDQNPTDFLKVRTRHQALRDIHGVYRFILKLSSAEAIAVRAPRVLQQYFDFGTTEASVVSPGLVRVVASGIPTFLVPWLRIVAETYLLVALEVAGAPSAQVRRIGVTPSGEGHGAPLATMGFEIRLAPPAPG